MSSKYSCPNCGKELSEADVIRGICSHCHNVFDLSTIKNASREKRKEALLQKNNSDLAKNGEGVLPEGVTLTERKTLGMFGPIVIGLGLLMMFVEFLGGWGVFFIITGAFIILFGSHGNVGIFYFGKCPYCGKDIFAKNSAFDCPICKERVALENNKFHTMKAMKVNKRSFKISETK